MTEFPSIYIHPIDDKGLIRQFDEEYIEGRMRTLQFFLTSILMNPNLRQSDSLKLFLSENDESKFEQNKKDLMTKLSTNKKFIDALRYGDYLESFTVKNLTTFSGKVRGAYSVHQQDFSILFNGLTEVIVSESENIHNLSNEIGKTLSKLSLQFEEMVASISSIRRAFSDYNGSRGADYPPADKIEEGFSSLSEVINTLRRDASEKAKFMEHSFSGTFKYAAKEFGGFDELLERRNLLGNTFMNLKNSLDKKKTDLFSKGYCDEWKSTHDLNPEEAADISIAKYCMLPDVHIIMIIRKRK